jgi:iron-sulfur cluster insertion protein
LRVYITGGGCSGFSYGFTFDDKHKEGDSGVEKNGVQLAASSKICAASIFFSFLWQ